MEITNDLKKYIIYRASFVVILALLTFLFLHFVDGGKGGFFTTNEVFLLACLMRILPLTLVLGTIDLIILAVKKKFTWVKLFTFLAIEILFIISIFILII